MSKYVYDMHVHTAEVSLCGHVGARELVGMYHDIGYSGLVITDHLYRGFFDRYPDALWDEEVEAFLEGYTIARATGQRLGMTILLGVELRFDNDPRDYLVYGADPTFLARWENLYELGIDRFHTLAKEEGLLVYQAHPFRGWHTQVNTKFLNGLEVVNGNPRHDSRNALAYRTARDNGLLMVSGSDFHKIEDLGRGGIVLPERPKTEQELVTLLKTTKQLELLGAQGLAKKRRSS